MEIVARRLGEALPGERLESAMTPGLNVLKTFDPPLHALHGAEITGVRRRGKLLLLDVETSGGEALTFLMHLMSAGRLQLFDKRASLRDRPSRVLLRLPGDRELRLREFGTKQAAWVKVLRTDEVEADEAIATLGPEAWPDPPPLRVHRHHGEPCPRCGASLEAVHYEDYVMSYCPQEQTGGRVLKDRRLSRLLK